MPSNSRPRFFYGWWIVAAGFVNQFMAQALLHRSYAAYITLLRDEFGWSNAQLSGAYSMQQVENGMLGPLQGWLVDRFGPRASMRTGVALLGAGFMLFSRIDSLVGFYAAFLMMSVGASLTGVLPYTVAIVNWFNRRRGRAMSTMQMGGAIGGLLIGAVAVALETVGWRTTAFASGVLVLLVGLPLTQIVRRRPEDFGLEVDGGAPPPAADDAPPGTPAAERDDGFTLREAVRTPAFWLISLGHASAVLIVSVVNVHVLLFLTEDLGYSLTFGSAVVTVLTIAQIAGIALGAVVGDMWDRRHIAVGCMAFHTAALLLLAYASSPLPIWAFAVMHGAAWGLRGPMMQAIRADYFGRRSFGSIAGASSLLVMIGTITGPLFAGYLADVTGDFRLGFSILAIVSGIGSVFFIVARRPQHGTRPPGGATTPASAARR
ncbi:MAG: MFS transporter [Dehalococcoidia bacterium]